MDVIITPLSAVEQQAEFTLSGGELEPHFDEAYRKFRPKAQVDGFRKGKVPLEIIRKLYGESIEHDALDDIADRLYRTAMEERNIRPLGRPAMVDMDFKRGSHFRFSIKYEIKPDIKLGEYRGIPVEKPVHAVSDEELDSEILHLRRSSAEKSDTTSAGDDDHIVTADVQELDAGGTPLIGKKSAGATFHLYDETLAPEIREVLRKAAVGESVRVSLAGSGDPPRTLSLELTVTGIQKLLVPAVDEEFVRKVTGGKLADAESLRSSMREDLTRYWDQRSESAVANALADEVVRLHDFPAPASLVEMFLDSFLEDVRSRGKGGKLPAGFDEQKFREENRAGAVWQAKWMLLKEQIAEAEGITVTDEELTQSAEAEAARTGLERERVLQYYRTSASVRDRMLSDKIMHLLRTHATISERTVDHAGHGQT